MTIIYSKFINKLIDSIPLIILYYLCLTEIDTELQISETILFNLKYIIVFYWTLRNPMILGYGHVFFAGILSDTVTGLPMGTSSFCYLVIASFAAYIRNVTVRVSLWSDWLDFVPSIFFTNLVFFALLAYYTNLSVNYNNLFYNSLYTILFYPIFWGLFKLINNFIRV